MRLKITSQVHVSLWLLALGLMLGNHLSPREGWAADTTYYVSSSDGADSNTGLSSGSGPNGPFKTIAKVNALALQPGDAVLFKCGDVWRAEMLVINKSGAAADPITFASYPGENPRGQACHSAIGNLWESMGSCLSAINFLYLSPYPAITVSETILFLKSRQPIRIASA